MKARIYFQCDDGCSDCKEVDISEVMKVINENVSISGRFMGRDCFIGTHSFGCEHRFNDKFIRIVYEPQGGFKGGT